MNLEQITKEVVEEIKEQEVKKVEEKQAKLEVEKAVNTLGTSTQFQTTARQFIFDGLSDGKVFYAPNTQIKMQASTVQIPVLGEAVVETGEGGITNDSDIGTGTITLNAVQYTARYPLSYLLEKAGGSELATALESNLKKSIARKYDSEAWGVLKGTPTNFDFATKTINDFYKVVVTTLKDKIDNPSNCAIFLEPQAYAWFAGQDAVFTQDKFGAEAVIKTGSIGKIFGMDAYLIGVTEAKMTVVIANKDYIASGQFGENIEYIKMIDNTGTTYIIGKALLAFGANISGVASWKQS